MPVETFEYRNEAERVAMMRAIAFVAQMTDLALSVPPGKVMDVCEQQALGAGHELLRDTLRQAVQTRIDQTEEKKGRHASARVGVGDG